MSVIAAPVFVLLIPIFDTTLVTIVAHPVGPLAGAGRPRSLVASPRRDRPVRAHGVLVLWLARGDRRRDRRSRCASAEAWSIAVGGLFVLVMVLFAVYLARIKVYDDPGWPRPPAAP